MDPSCENEERKHRGPLGKRICLFKPKENQEQADPKKLDGHPALNFFRLR